MPARRFTDEQEAEIARRYVAGESTAQLAPCYSVSMPTIGQILKRQGVDRRSPNDYRRGKPNLEVRKVTEDQILEMKQLYQSGFTTRQIGGKFSVSYMTVRRYLLMEGGLRNRSQAAMIFHGHEAAVANAISGISKERLAEMYWGANSGCPSIKELSKKLQIGRKLLADLFRINGIVTRTQSQQMKADFLHGRRSGEPPHLKGSAHPSFGKSHIPHHLQTAEARKKHREAAARRRVPPIAKTCAWCGETVFRSTGQVNKSDWYSCSIPHRNAYSAFRRFHPEAPRPLIVEKLTALVNERYGALRNRDSEGRRQPNTWEQIEKAGAEIGAQEPEIYAVLDAQSFEEPQPVKTARAQGMDLAILR